jgi:Helicase associated domain
MDESWKRRLEELGFVWELRRRGVKRKFIAGVQPQHDTPAQNDVDRGWDMKFADLHSYRAAHGHCNVPIQYNVRLFCIGSVALHFSHFPWLSIDSYLPIELCCFQENPALGHWVKNQRQKYKTGTMDESRKCRLEELGFLWDALCERGKRKLSTVGQPHCDAPAQSDADYRWDLKFAELQSYRAAYGHCNVPYNDSVRRCFSQWFNYFHCFSSHFSLAFHRFIYSG